MDTRRLRLLKIALGIAGLLPLVRLCLLATGDGLGANPVEFVIRSSGTWALSLLLLALAVTPLRRISGAAWLAGLRRMLGLYAFFYALLHALAYVWLDHWFDWDVIGDEIVRHPYLLAGVAAFTLLIPLAATSTDGMMRRLGWRWKQLHRAVYLIAALAVLHDYWLVKKDITQPVLYALLLGVLLGLRLAWMLRSRRHHGGAAAAAPAHRQTTASG